MFAEGGDGGSAGGAGAAAGAAPDPPGDPAAVGRSLEVLVEASLADVLVVSCLARGRRFQGVLLDCSKRNLAFGVNDLHPAFDDRLHSVGRRFAYLGRGEAEAPPPPKKTARPSKMTVRLRPRKVLCSECKGVCNENTGSVVRASKRRAGDAAPNGTDDAKRPARRMAASLIPKISRLHPDEITNALNGNRREAETVEAAADEASRSTNSNSNASNGSNASSERNSDESDASPAPSRPNPRTLKISFGGGEGTVVKLPAEEDAPADPRAARRALKKAKKRARRRRPSAPEPEPEPGPDGPPPRGPRYEIFPEKRGRKAKRKKKRKDARKERTPEPDAGRPPSEEARPPEGPPEPAGPVDDDAPEDGPPENGPSVEIGDVIWGKLQGFPWWPGRVLELEGGGRARVAWFASGASSLVPHGRLAPFLDNFKVHFNKKKRGHYREAVRQATLEAGGPLDPLGGDPPAVPQNMTLAPLSSPPIDVLS